MVTCAAALFLPEAGESSRQTCVPIRASEHPAAPSVVLCKQKGLKSLLHRIQLADTG